MAPLPLRGISCDTRSAREEEKRTRSSREDRRQASYSAGRAGCLDAMGEVSDSLETITAFGGDASDQLGQGLSAEVTIDGENGELTRAPHNNRFARRGDRQKDTKQKEGQARQPASLGVSARRCRRDPW